MKVKAIYNGFGLATIQPRLGVGEQVVPFAFEGKEPKVDDVVFIDINANDRDEVTLAQEAAYKKAQGV